MEKRVIGTILGVVALIVVVAGSTAAWFTWQSTETQKTAVNFTVSGLTDDTITTNVAAEGTLTGTLTPVANKTNGVIKTFTVTKDAAFANDVYLSFTLALTTFPSGLSHQSLRWEFVSVGANSTETTLGSGNFSGKSQGDNIKLLTSPATRHTLATGTNSYKLYIWIDGTQSNPAAMQNQTYSFTLTIDGTDQAGAAL